MKKYIVALVAFVSLLSANMAEAQLRIGPMAGVSFTTLKFNQGGIVSVDGAAGPAAGVFLEKMFPGIGFGIDMGLMYSMKGATVNFANRKIWADDGVASTRSMLHYVELPINVRFKYTHLQGFEDYLAPFIFAGPEFSFLAGHNKILTSNKEQVMNYNAATVGLTVGLGAEIFKNWQLSGSYTWGVTTAVQTVKLDDYKANNRGWNIRAAYLF